MDISDRERSSGSPKFDEDLKVVASDSDIATEPVDDEITSGDPAAHRLRADIQCFGDLWDGIHRSDSWWIELVSGQLRFPNVLLVCG